MIEIKGTYGEAKVFTDMLEESARGQISALCEQKFVKDSKIRIMPDVHAEQIQSCENAGYYLVHLNSRWDQDLEACYYETIGLSANDINVYIKD